MIIKNNNILTLWRLCYIMAITISQKGGVIMSRTPKNVSDEDAREITEYLLNKGIPQTKIASTVKRSQSWVAGVKRERDIARYAKEAGRQELQTEIIENVKKQAADTLSNRILQRNGVKLLPTDDD